ncbi:MAG: hypothetical protein P1V97_20900 [Planctomycetota bacterium]|nr:hypothetical protein [Planctomycetota bacterium]
MSLPGPHEFIEGCVDHSSFTSKLLHEAAQRCGYRFMIEPEFGYVGRIEANGRRFLYKGGLFDMNTACASALTRDKAYSFALLKEQNLLFPKTRSFFSPDFEAFAMLRGTAKALKFAEEIGYPVFVKPNEGTRAFGAHKADNPDQLCWALERSFGRREGRVSLVQDFVPGDELRLLVVDGTVELAYRKRPYLAQADGQKTVLELLKEAQRHVLNLKGGRKTFDLDDARITDSLRRRGLNLQSRPEEPFLLSDGLTLELGNGVEILDNLSAEIRDSACRALKAIGRYGSVDAILTAKQEFYIIELNSAPGVTGLASLGHRERAVELYCKVLRAYFEA